MNTKLKLRMDENLINAAKKYSAKTGKSVSRIVADLFEIIQNEKVGNDASLTPAVKSIKGVLKGKQVEKADYKKYLKDKYL